jgi:hypothetical protein
LALSNYTLAVRRIAKNGIATHAISKDTAAIGAKAKNAITDGILTGYSGGGGRAGFTLDAVEGLALAHDSSRRTAVSKYTDPARATSKDAAATGAKAKNAITAGILTGYSGGGGRVCYTLDAVEGIARARDSDRGVAVSNYAPAAARRIAENAIASGGVFSENAGYVSGR